MSKYIKLEDAINAIEDDKFYTYKNLESLPTIEVSEDCIDRYSALAELDPRSYEYKAVKKLPPVIPQPKEGEWIPCTKEGLPLTELGRREGQKWYGYKCSKCNFIYKGNALTESPFCQSCGNRMKGADNEA